ncbi:MULTISPECIES: epoxide hydrolase family protein [Aminobacter]|uniref:Pimeloyl-ACP methyl ester carboxylesterase n=1 Tax=Aminobacter aminovorans TaxID=83263 RepID=A0AAC8YKC3_AMIAI|nr:MULTISPECIES: epoxide hydrolase family protein [Aminobacter]AMS39469.1 Soluble epoxide hydrolase [Aminobacter aminovorans]MBB3707616.1 pimeloyl-ACP methyl ester carboxylesterase [Aminobacter aminovorans]MRX34690.1 alpha/beta fold hydrolase [Aminobacter sp. MDW-2]QNH34945.1 epoxide hydrolase [Aminobacter sp. MDW-2]
MSDITPFKIAISEADLADLKARLANTRLANEIPGTGWSYGMASSFVTRAIERLKNGFDWRTQEAAINANPQFVTEIDGQTIHFLHVKSGVIDAVPLLLLHGWPSSFVEFLGAIGPLTAAGYDLVIPSLPGFGFSGPTREAGWNDGRIASAMLELMSRLGYKRFGVQGGDAGAIIAPAIGRAAPDRVIGVHVNAATMGFIPLGPIDPSEIAMFSDAEKSRLQRLQQFMAERFGFNALQSSRPQTLAYGISDSPAGLIAWLGDMFAGFGDSPDAVELDRFLTNVLVYWFTGTAASSTRLYYENAHDPEAWSPKPNSGVPTGVAVFARDEVAIRRYGEEGNTILRWTELASGGHFAAMEVPEVWAEEVAAFFAGLQR